MSTFEPARPRYTLPFAGKEYELLGTFGLIEAVEYATKEHVGQVAVRVVNGMTTYDLAKLLAAILTACGHKTSTKEAGDLIWENVGASGEDNDLLRLHLYSFLCICLAPPSQREKKAREAGETIGKLKDRPVSFPWTQYRRVCLGVLRMQPSEFWGSDTWTVMDAYDGYAISKGVKKQEGRPWTKDDMDELERMMEEDEKRMTAGKQ